jgi:hypothetical protein
MPRPLKFYKVETQKTGSWATMWTTQLKFCNKNIWNSLCILQSLGLIWFLWKTEFYKNVYKSLNSMFVWFESDDSKEAYEN